MEFPYQLIDFDSQGERFSLVVNSIDVGTSATKQYGVTGAFFSAILDVPGVNANISCDFTLGNLYEFYNQLKECCEKVAGNAILKDYSSQNTMLEIGFINKTGHVDINGKLVNKGTKNMIGFAFNADQTYITPILASLKSFFDELTEIQGFGAFPY